MPTALTDWREVAAAPPDPDLPLLVVHGNCQAEALRVLAASALQGEAISVRVPPVFELSPGDIEDYHRLLRRTDLLVTQPVVDEYRGLPLGTAQVARLLPAGSRVARVPVLRWAALMPTHAIVRAAGHGDPPLVPYHDLRVIAAAARGSAEVDLSEPSARGVLAIGDITRQQLRRRQDAHGTVDALPALKAAGVDAAWTINHPGNGVLMEVARLALRELGYGGLDVDDPGRVLLRTTSAPVWASTLGALGLDGEPRSGWHHAGRTFTEEQVAAAQLEWYRAHPAVVDAALSRHRESLEVLELL